MIRQLCCIGVLATWLGSVCSADAQQPRFGVPSGVNDVSQLPPPRQQQYLLPAVQTYSDPASSKPATSDATTGSSTSSGSSSSSSSESSSEPKFTIDFKDGVNFKTNDGIFSLKINSLLQIDYRDFTHTAGDLHTGNSLHDNFAMPRIRLFFRGNVTEFVDYATSLTTGISPNAPGNVPAPANLLDAYLDFNPFGKDYKEYFQVRVGRFKTPYLYQFYKISPQDFVTPELSMFSTNFLQNWENGLMAHGLLLDKRFDYAAGVFNGVPNSFEVPQNNRQAILFGALTPFLHHECNIFQHLTISGSYAVGYQYGTALPNALGTAVASNGPPDNLEISPTFLLFNGNAIMSGYHQLTAVDLIWNYKCINFYGEYNSGQQTYASTAPGGKTTGVSLSGYSAAVTYFFTGETITTTRARIKPLHDYNWCAGTWGALEGFARFSNLSMGTNVTQNGLLVPGANANQVNATDIGFHWYLNEYVRISFDWQHAMFNQPISMAPGTAGARTTGVEDLFWMRFQLYY